jgi:thiamine biosynthesis lipoprotein
MQTVALARHAMATRFELVLHGDNAVSLRAAGEEALDEVERLEAQLSLYRPDSELSHLNQHAAHAPVRVTPGLFHLLQRAQRLSAETTGWFDITIAPLMRCWGFLGGPGQLPDPTALAEAKSKVGQHLVVLNKNDFTVRFLRAGVMLDLGAIGKGYALERAADILREAGVHSALLHGGTSTVHALGTPPQGGAWQVAVERPPAHSESETTGRRRAAILATIPLQDEALSVSAVWGKSFQAGGKTFGHVLNPRTGEPADGALLAAVVLPSATETDALSTALLTAGLAGHDDIARLRPGMRTLVVARNEETGKLQLKARGIAGTTDWDPPP